MHKSIKVCLATALLAMSAGLSRAAVEVTPVRVDETRSTQLADERLKFPLRNEVKLQLQLTGPEAAKAIRYGKLHLAEAVDDLGTDLIPREKDPFGVADSYKEFDNEFFRKNAADQSQIDPPKVEIKLTLPPRKATKIRSVKGQFELLDAGTQQTIQVSPVEVAGKQIDDPNLAKIGLKLKVRSPQGDNLIGRQSLDVEVTGDSSAIASLEVLDSAGKVVSRSSGSFRFNDGPETRSLSLQSPIDAKMVLRIKISLDRNMTRVPFELKDIPLR